MEEITKVIKQLKSGKVCGPDLVLNEFFKFESQTLQQFIHQLFNKLFKQGYFPDTWSEGYTVPLHKKCDQDDPGNYRGITLLSTLGKLFTKVLHNRLNSWAEIYNVYIEAQSGFRENMSTIDNIFVLHGLINHMINNNKRMYVAFIDYTKAFDYVVRDILWYKLIKLGVRGKF